MDCNDYERKCLESIKNNDIEEFNRYFNYTLYHNNINSLIKSYKLLFLLFTDKYSEYYNLLEFLTDEELNSKYIEIVFFVEQLIQMGNLHKFKEILSSIPKELSHIMKYGYESVKRSLEANTELRKVNKKTYEDVIRDCIDSFNVSHDTIN